MPATASERMSRVDTAWLRMDNDVNLMMIVGVWLLRPALAYDELCERVAAKLLRYDRFRQKVVSDAMGALWVDDGDFDIHHHVVREKLVRRKGQSERAALQALCGSLATKALDPGRPLWQFHLVEGYEGGSALIVRIHHCIGDGIALISVALSITDGGGEPPQRRARRVDARHHRGAAQRRRALGDRRACAAAGLPRASLRRATGRPSRLRPRLARRRGGTGYASSISACRFANRPCRPVRGALFG